MAVVELLERVVVVVLNVVRLWAWGWVSPCGDLESGHGVEWWSLVGSGNVVGCVVCPQWQR